MCWCVFVCCVHMCTGVLSADNGRRGTTHVAVQTAALLLHGLVCEVVPQHADHEVHGRGQQAKERLGEVGDVD